jgi:hypothetical protein
VAAGGAALVTTRSGQEGLIARTKGDTMGDVGESLKKFEKNTVSRKSHQKDMSKDAFIVRTIERQENS